jgi:predicted O-methyltransferase YrrM
MVMQEYDLQSLPQAGWAKDAYRGALSEGDRPVMVDCGGHIGLSAVWFASHFLEAAVYSIEPDISNCQLLQKNTDLFKRVAENNFDVVLRGENLLLFQTPKATKTTDNPLPTPPCP